MTREKLEEIKKLAVTWLGKEKDFYATGRDAAMHQFLVAMREHALPLIEALEEAWARCEKLRELADEKAHDAGLYARRMEEAQKARSEALAEVAWLRDVVRQVHALTSGSIVHSVSLHAIHKITKGMVE